MSLLSDFPNEDANVVRFWNIRMAISYEDKRPGFTMFLVQLCRLGLLLSWA